MAKEVTVAKEAKARPLNAQRTGERRKTSLNPKTVEYLKSERNRYMDMMYRSPASEREYFISAIDRIDEYLRGDRPWV